MNRYTEDFRLNLIGFDFDTLENSSEIIYALSDDLKLIYFNPSWVKFADENNGNPEITDNFPLGTSIQSVLPEKLSPIYIEKYMEVMSKNKKWQNNFECSSKKLQRIFNQTVYPLNNKRGLLVVNRLRIEKPMDRDNHSANIEQYTFDTGFIHQCSNCRCIQRATNENVWDWVSVWVSEFPSNTSHTICPVCFDHHWKLA